MMPKLKCAKCKKLFLSGRTGIRTAFETQKGRFDSAVYCGEVSSKYAKYFVAEKAEYVKLKYYHPRCFIRFTKGK